MNLRCINETFYRCNKLFIRWKKTLAEGKDKAIGLLKIINVYKRQKDKKATKMKSQFFNKLSYLKIKWTSL